MTIIRSADRADQNRIRFLAVFSFCLLLNLSRPAIALIEAPPELNVLDIDAGLPSLMIEGITQDSSGYIWIATANGLVRHDGHELQVMRHEPDQSGSLPGNNIQSILAARNGSIWAAVSGQGVVEIRGLEVYRHWKPRSRHGRLHDDFIWGLAQDCNDQIWLMFARGGLAKIDPISGQVEHIQKGTNGIPGTGFQIDLLVDSKCNLWLLKPEALLLADHVRLTQFEEYLESDRLPDSGMISIYETPESALFLTSASGIYRLSDEASPANQKQGWIRTEGSVTSIVAADRDHLWVGMSTGLALFNQTTGTFRYFSNPAGNDHQHRSLNRINQLYQDSEGSLWVSQFQRGMVRLAPGWRGFRKLMFDLGEPVRSRPGNVGALNRGAVDESVLYTTEMGDLYQLRFDQTESTGEFVNQPIASLNLADKVVGIVSDDESVWLASEDQLVRVDTATGEHQQLKSFNVHQIPRLFIAQETGYFWFYDIQGRLKLLDRNGNEKQIWETMGVGADGPGIHLIHAIVRGPDDSWWVLSDYSIHRVVGDGSFERILHRPGLRKQSITTDRNHVWISGDSFLELLIWKEGTLESERRWLASDGLPLARILRVFPRGEKVWLLLESGVAGLDLIDNSFRIYTRSEGLPVSYFSANAAVVTEHGRIIAGTPYSLVIIDPDQIRSSEQPPPTHLVEVRAGDEIVTLHPEKPEIVHFEWQRNSVEFSFAALSYLNPARNEFRLRLNGWDTEWQYQIGQYSRYYSNLPSGRYEFEIQAANVEGDWNETGDRISIRIDPPPWRSGAAIILYCLMAPLLVFVAVRMLIMARQRRLELVLAREQRALARSQREFLDALNISLEPSALAKTIGHFLLDLLDQSKGYFGYLTDDMPQEIAALGEIEQARDMGRSQFISNLQRPDLKDGQYIELSTDQHALAAMYLPDVNSVPDELVQSEIELLTQAAAQVLQNARLLISVRRYAQEADVANQAKSDFLATMSHEIRTPLHGLLGMIDLMGRNDLSPQAAEMLRTMRTSGHQLQRILNDILDLSRIEARQISLKQDVFEMVHLLEHAVELHAANAAVKQLDLRLRMASELPAIAVGDADRITQVLGNLISNAIKFTEQGAIEVDAWSDARHGLNVSVSDTGPGIDPKFQTHLFEPFTQLEMDNTRKHSGTGLGLAISRRIVDVMGGTLELQSQVGQGSRFTLRLPLAGMRSGLPRNSMMLAGFRLGAAVSPAYRRILLRMCRRWNMRLVRAESRVRMDGLIIQADCYSAVQLEQWLSAGVPIWSLSPPGKVQNRVIDGVRSIRLPLITSRLVASLLDQKIKLRA